MKMFLCPQPSNFDQECPPKHIGTEPHFVPVGDTRNVKGGQKQQSWWSTHFVDQHICWCGWCSVTVRFVVSVLLNDPFCWFGEVLRNNNLYQRPILLVSITYTCRKVIPPESTFCVLRNNNLYQRQNRQKCWCRIVKNVDAESPKMLMRWWKNMPDGTFGTRKRSFSTKPFVAYCIFPMSIPSQMWTSRLFSKSTSFSPFNSSPGHCWLHPNASSVL